MGYYRDLIHSPTFLLYLLSAVIIRAQNVFLYLTRSIKQAQLFFSFFGRQSLRGPDRLDHLISRHYQGHGWRSSWRSATNHCRSRFWRPPLAGNIFRSSKSRTESFMMSKHCHESCAMCTADCLLSEWSCDCDTWWNDSGRREKKIK